MHLPRCALHQRVGLTAGEKGNQMADNSIKRRRVLAILAGGAVVGIGAAVTLAA